MTTLSQPDAIADAGAWRSLLSLEDKVALLTGENMWQLPALPVIGLRRLAFSDGPVGVRGLGDVPGQTSRLFPCPSAIGATWDTDLAHAIGQAFAVEARAHGVDVVLAPQVNIQRTPVAGRHFECYSEDPWLTSVIGVTVARGLQSQGVGACIKHYIANDSETDRTTYVSQVDPRALREVYLAPFEDAVTAGVWSVMAAYNRADDGIESAPMTAHDSLLNGLLKGDLGFDGVVVSDWVAARTTAPAANGGLDVVMPGPGGPWGEHLIAAVKAGQVSEQVIDDKIERVLRLATRVGAVGDSQPVTYDADLDLLIRRAAAQATVVLRSASDTPVWERPAPAAIALIGPNAVRPHVMGGGSSSVSAPYVVTPAEGLAARFPDAQLTVERGGDARQLAPTLDLTGATFAIDHLAADGSVVRTEVRDEWPGWMAGLADDVDAIQLRLSMTLTEPGDHTIEVGTVGAHHIEIDDSLVSASDERAGVEVVLDSSINTPPGHRAIVSISQPSEISVTSRHQVIHAADYGRLVRADLRHRRPGPSDDDEIAAAVEAAAGAELTVVVVGTNEEVESEGWDRSTLALPGRQNELVERVLDVAPDAVIMVNAGAPVELPWLTRAETVLWSWFPGQECGHAIADVLAGVVEPAGRLPWTLPTTLADAPVPHAIPDDGQIVYDDGIHVGYRGWDRAGRTPALPFGFGLGWTTWSYDAIGPAVVGDDGAIEIEVSLTNTGRRTGIEVVQAYLSAPQSGWERPIRWLAGFVRIEAEPGERVTVTVPIARRRLEIWNDADNRWELPPGEYRICVGRSVHDIRLDTAVQVGERTPEGE